MWQHGTGISGLISLLLTPLIAWPMLFPRLRKGIRFEVRKALHYLSIVWAVSICFHAPKRHIAIIMGLSVGLYAVDWLYGYFFKVYHAETLRFTRIGNAVEVVWEHPQGFESKGAGYVYINLPWIARGEWHAFIARSSRTLHCPITHACAWPWSAIGRRQFTRRSPSQPSALVGSMAPSRRPFRRRPTTTIVSIAIYP